MRDDETFVLNAVARHLSGTWEPGENPPDGYLTIGDRTVAVEVTTLTQHVTDDRGTHPRLSDDMTAMRLANALDDELKGAIPDDKRVMLVLSAPIANYRKTKAMLATEIVSFVNQHPGPVRAELKTLIQGNEIEICLYESTGAERKRITGLITNRASSPDILRNVSHILEDRISVKAEKCKKLSGPIWLAMLNDYFLTEADTYRYALKSIAVKHPFERALLVESDGSVEVLMESISNRATC